MKSDLSQTEINNLVLRANALLKTNWLHAVNILEQAIIQHPYQPDLLQNLGDIYLHRQLYDKALVCYQDAMVHKPQDPSLLFLIGNCYFALGEYRIANSYYNNIPDPPPEVIYNKALCLSFSGNPKESINLILKIIDVMSDNPFIYFLLIEQYLRQSNLDEALAVIRKAEAKFGNHNQLLLFSAMIHAKKGIWLKAYHAFHQCDQITPLVNRDYLVNYGLAAKKIGFLDTAVTLMMRARDLDPYSSSIHEELIRLQLQLNDFTGAQKSIDIAKKYLHHFSPMLRLLQERLGSHID